MHCWSWKELVSWRLLCIHEGSWTSVCHCPMCGSWSSLWWHCLVVMKKRGILRKNHLFHSMLHHLRSYFWYIWHYWIFIAHISSWHQSNFVFCWRRWLFRTATKRFVYRSCAVFKCIGSLISLLLLKVVVKDAFLKTALDRWNSKNTLKFWFDLIMS